MRFREPAAIRISLGEREGAGLRILAAPDAHIFQGGRDRFAYYVDVRDVDAIHAELKLRLNALPEEHVHGPPTRTMDSASC